MSSGIFATPPLRNCSGVPPKAHPQPAGAPCQALRVCSQSHFRTSYGTVGNGCCPFAYVDVTYQAVRYSYSYSYVGVTYRTVTYYGVTFAYVDVTYREVSYPNVTYCYVVVTYGYVGKGCH